MNLYLEEPIHGQLKECMKGEEWHNSFLKLAGCKILVTRALSFLEIKVNGSSNTYQKLKRIDGLI